MTSSPHPNKIVYFDNAATTFPKPESVVEAVAHYMRHIGGNPGRSGHALSVAAGKIVFSARRAIADLFGLRNPMRIVFCANATDALNLAIQGVARAGDHVITTAMEHNSTIRPLKELEREGTIALSIIECPDRGILDFNQLKRSIKPETRMMVINHASNVFGTVQPLWKIGEICRERGIVLVADCAQSAGIIPMDMQDNRVDLLAFSGHKGFYGPTGTGGLAIADEFDFTQLRPLTFGGTGSHSDKISQPPFLPDRFESGTLNVAGLCGLEAGVFYLNERAGGIAGIRDHAGDLVNYFLSKAKNEIEGFIDYIPAESVKTGVVSFNIDGISSSTVAQMLAEEHGIMCRAGLHCAPLAHKTLGTFPEGAVRFGFGIFNTKEEIDAAVDVLKGMRDERR